VGDIVDVLNAFRLPKFEEVIGRAIVQKVTGEFPNQLYWLDGNFLTGKDARQLRLVLRGSGR
jgi:hypothetical protein